jgi:signal transduction histidine kinase
MLRRLATEATQPVLAFALFRLALAASALVLLVAFDFPTEGRAAAVLGFVALPWSVAVLWLARGSGDAALNPLVAVGDLAVLVTLDAVAPETYGFVRFVALAFIAVHSNFLGERWGLAVAAGGAGALVLATALRGGAVVEGDLLALYEATFVLAALATGVLVGRLRTTESASRLRARGVTRRTIEAEREVRRRVAESIHDGPVQELIGLDMVLSAAGQAADGGDSGQLGDLIAEARTLTERNVQALRDEIVDLGPYAFEELSFDTAVSRCLATWKRRYGLDVLVAIEEVELPPELAADLFYITQEAVTNVGKHAEASTASISLRSFEGDVELRVMDDGGGFGEVDPLAPGEPGHLGLASMRERAELLDGTLTLESSERGTKLVVRVPLTRKRGLLRR